MICCCYHKSAPIVQSDCVQPLQVGRACSPIALPMGGDDSGESISERNPYWCELTALYWMWKNATDDPVGLMHYRRIFNLRNDHTRAWVFRDRDASLFGLTQARVTELLTQADIILPEKKPLRRKSEVFTTHEHYAVCHPIEDLDLAVQVLLEKHPGVEKTVNRVLHEETQGYWTNMFITTRSVLDGYAAWLFEILFEVERRLQPRLATRDPYQQRVYGFLAERLFNIWLALHPEVRILEMPTLFLTPNPLSYGCYWIRRWGHRLGIG